MDTSHYPSLPYLGQVNARLRRNNHRVEAAIDAQLDEIERLFHAATVEDWSAIADASRELADSVPELVGNAVIREAQAVCNELNDIASGANKPKHLDSLLDACRCVRKNCH